jgi:hypothetical protein
VYAGGQFRICLAGDRQDQWARNYYAHARDPLAIDDLDRGRAALDRQSG